MAFTPQSERSRGLAEICRADYIKEELAPLVIGNPQKYVGQIISEPYERYVAREVLPRGYRLLAEAAAPTLLALVAGFLFAWVRRGFKSDA